MKNNITFIIPLHTFDSEVETYLEKSLKSIKENCDSKKNTVIIVGPSDVLGKVDVVYTKTKCKCNLQLLENTGTTDPFTQINMAVYKCVTPYFSVIEFDDEYYSYWVDEVSKYLNTEYASSVYIPLTELINTEGNIVQFVNEIALSNSFSNELGLIDIEALEAYMDFNVTGAIIKTEDFITAGGLKPSLGIAAWYEFLLRMCHNSYVVRVIPKVGYRHTVGRENSYSVIQNKALTPEHGSWLIKTAQQEYFFKEDRNKTFEQENTLKV